MPDVEIDRRTTEMNYQQIIGEVCVITKLVKVATRAPWQEAAGRIVACRGMLAESFLISP